MSAADFILGIENLALLGAVATGRLGRPVRRPVRVRVCCRNLTGTDSDRAAVDDAPAATEPDALDTAPLARDMVASVAPIACAPIVRHFANGKFADTP